MHCFVLEHIDGYSLEQRRVAAGGKLSEREVCNAMKDVLTGLMEVHKRKIVHKDIKPQNIMVQAVTKMCKIVDFGVSSTDRARGVGTPCAFL